MAILPFPKPADVGQLDVRSAGVPQSERGGNAYGAQKWDEVRKIGQVVQGIGDQFIGIGARQQASQDAFDVAKASASSSFQEENNKIIIGQEDPSGAQLVPDLSKGFDKYQNDQMAAFVKTGASPKAQKAYAIQLLEEKRRYLDNGAVTATKMAAINSAREVDMGLRTVLNDIAVNGATSKEDFEVTVAKGVKLINDTPGSEKNVKEQSIADFKNKAAILRFETVLYPKAGGLTKENVEAIQKELDDPYWAKQLETGSLDKIRDALAASRSAFAELSVEGQSSTHVNKVASDPATYEAELANLLGVDTKGLSGVKIAANQRNVVSDMTRVRFESLAEQAVTGGDELMTTGKAKSRDEAEAGIIALQKDLVTNPVWGERLTSDQFTSLKNSLQTRKNALDKDWNELQRATKTEHDAKVTLERADVAATATNFKARQEKGGRIPEGEFKAWMDARLKLGDDNLTASQKYLVDDVYNQQITLSKLGNHPTQAQIDAARAEADRGGSGIGVQHSPDPAVSRGDGDAGASGVKSGGGGGGGGGDVGNIKFGPRMRSVPARTKQLSANDPRLAPVKTAGGATFMIDREHQAQLQGFIRDYEAAGGVIGPNSGTVAGRPGNASLHPIGGAIDVNQIGRGKRAGGKSLPLDVEDKIAAKWGMRSGNHFRNNDNGHFDFGGGVGGRGGGGGAGRSQVRGFYRALSGFEASGENAPHSYATTSSGMARGWFQITDGTWKDFGGLATGYKTAYDAPYDVQKSIADKIPMGRWASRTLDKMRAAGWTIDPDKTLAENAALNGDDGSGGPADTGGSGGDTGGGRTSLLAVPRTAAQDSAYTAIDNAQKALSDGLKNNTVAYGAQQLGVAVVGLDPAHPETFDQRATLFGKIDEFNNKLSPEQQHPLTQEDVNVLSDMLNSNDSEKINQVYAALDRWSPEMREMAYKDLAQTAPFGAAAGRVYASNRKDIANLAQRGHKGLVMMDDNKVEPVWTKESKDWFGNMGDVLRGLSDPTKGVGIKQVIDAVYWARHGNEEFDPAHYQQAAEDVMGVHFDTVNGGNAALIPGTTGKEWELALPTLDLTAVSFTHTPPVAEDVIKGGLGSVAPVAQENLIPVRMSEGLYAFMDTDGGLLHTFTTEGKAQFYLAQLNAQIIKEAAAKAAAAGKVNHPDPWTAGPSSLITSEPLGVPIKPAPLAPQPGLPYGGRPNPSDIPPPAPGVPLSPTRGFTQREEPWTPAQEKALEDYADDYADMLRRNGAGKAEADAARSQMLDDIRATRRTIDVGEQQ